MYLRGEVSLEEAIREIKVRTHRYIRRQYTWFSLKDPRIEWFESREENFPKIVSLVEKWFYG